MNVMDEDWVIIGHNNSTSSSSCTLRQTVVHFLYTTLYSLFVPTAYFHKACTVEGSLAGNNGDDRILLTW